MSVYRITKPVVPVSGSNPHPRVEQGGSNGLTRCIFSGMCLCFWQRWASKSGVFGGGVPARWNSRDQKGLLGSIWVQRPANSGLLCWFGSGFQGIVGVYGGGGSGGFVVVVVARMFMAMVAVAIDVMCD